MFDPHKEKYHDMYLEMAEFAASQSTSNKRKVGAVLVTQSGLLSIGYNGTPAGWNSNECEDTNVKEDGSIEMTTYPHTIHAEMNCIDKMTRQGVPTGGSILFTTLSPCFNCALALHGLGLKAIYYRDTYKCVAGVEFLNDYGIPTRALP